MFYILKKTRVFDQSEHAQDPIFLSVGNHAVSSLIWN